jgi:hypothetical protein
MADRKVLFRSGANVNEASPTADRVRAIGMLSGAASLTLENSGGQTAVLSATQLTLSGTVDMNSAGGGNITGFTNIGGKTIADLTEKDVAELITGGWTFQRTSPSFPSLIAKANAGQAAASNVFEVQNDAGTVIMAVQKNGDMTVQGAQTFVGGTTFQGSIDLGDADTDTISFIGEVDTHIIPDVDNTFDLGTLTGPKRWRTGIFGTSLVAANITIGPSNTISSSAGLIIDPTTTLTFELTDNNATALSIAEGAQSYLLFSTVNGSEQITVGNGTTNPIVRFSGSGSVAPSADNTVSLGVTGLGWSNFWLRTQAGSATVNLRASTASADGALAVGYDPTGRINITALNVSDALDQLDTAVGSSGSVTFTALATIDAYTLVRTTTTNNNATMALATSEANSKVVGFSVSAITAAATGSIYTAYGSRITSLKFVAGLTLAANDDVFLSAVTAGRATNVAPTTSGQVVKKVGLVKDATAYAGGADDPADVIFQLEVATLIA